jgi:Ulp1 family protease
VCQYPPPGSPGAAGSIQLTLDDYQCLEDDSFLNDSVIEFYMRWIQHELLSESDRKRTHFFATFFYNKLTKRPARSKNKLHPVEDNQVGVDILSKF